MRLSAADIQSFLRDHRRMALRPSTGPEAIFEGTFEFMASPQNGEVITDSYNLRVTIDESFPHALPTVWETGGRIERIDCNHVNPHDGSLCLGSPFSLRQASGRTPTICSFAEQCIIPFLYAASIRERRNLAFPFGELNHGAEGLLEDYERMLNVRGRDQVRNALRAIATRKRISNKWPCPCGCNRRLGACSLHFQLNLFRKSAPRSFYATLKI